MGVLRFDSRRGLGIFLFTTASRTALGPTELPIQWVPGALSLEVKRPGREADHSPPSSAEVKECVELYLRSLNTPSWCDARLKKHRDKFAFTQNCSPVDHDPTKWLYSLHQSSNGDSAATHCFENVKVKLSVCLTKHHARKTYWKSGGIAPHILDLGTRWRWVVSFTFRPLYPQGKNPRDTIAQMNLCTGSRDEIISLNDRIHTCKSQTQYIH
jgi:hypothetical protein